MRYVLWVALLSCVACSPGNHRTQTSRSGDAEPGVDSAPGLMGLDSLEGRFLAAYDRKDLDGILATYTDDIRFVIEGKRFDGKAAIRKAWERSLPAMGGLKFQPVTRTVQGDLGVSLESFAQRFREPGKPEQADSGYSLGILRRQSDGRWLFQTVMLSRPPAKATTSTRGK